MAPCKIYCCIGSRANETYHEVGTILSMDTLRLKQHWLLDWENVSPGCLVNELRIRSEREKRSHVCRACSRRKASHVSRELITRETLEVPDPSDVGTVGLPGHSQKSSRAHNK